MQESEWTDGGEEALRDGVWTSQRRHAIAQESKGGELRSIMAQRATNNETSSNSRPNYEQFYEHDCIQYEL